LHSGSISTVRSTPETGHQAFRSDLGLARDRHHRLVTVSAKDLSQRLLRAGDRVHARAPVGDV
jgi:hypothetical protein